MSADVYGPCLALMHHNFFGDAVDIALVILANRTSEDNPVTFPVADALVFFRLLLFGCWASHGYCV